MKHRKRKWRWLRYRKDDVAHNLLVAAQRWIHANKGTAVVIGGITTIVMPDDLKFNYYVAVHCTGIKPLMARKIAALRKEAADMARRI